MEIKQILKRILPPGIRKTLRKAWDVLYDTIARFYYRCSGKSALPIPPYWLRLKTGWQKDIEDFLRIGSECSGLVKNELSKQGRSPFLQGKMLDFGCGCGRTIRWLKAKDATAVLYGVDIDPQAIGWCRRNLGFAEFLVNKPLSPLPFSDKTFDQIYSISVFTHIDQEEQDHNLKELKRVLKPGGLLLITVHLKYALDRIIKKEVPVEGSIAERLARAGELSGKGFIFEPYATGRAYGLSFHTEEHIRSRWSRYFDVVNINPEGWQAVVVLKNY